MNASTQVSITTPKLKLDSDGAYIGFGANNEVTLTHVHNDGLILSGNDQLQFGDSGTYIHQSADGVLDLVSDTEIELNASTVDINASIEVSSTSLFTGPTTHNGGILIANDTTIGSVGDIDAMTISAAGLVTFSKPVVPATQTAAFSSLSSGVLNLSLIHI